MKQFIKRVIEFLNNYEDDVTFTQRLLQQSTDNEHSRL